MARLEIIDEDEEQKRGEHCPLRNPSGSGNSLGRVSSLGDPKSAVGEEVLDPTPGLPADASMCKKFVH